MPQTITVNVVSSVSTGPEAGYFLIPGNFTSLFYPGFQFMLYNSTATPYPETLPYTVVSSQFVAGSTQVNVAATVYGSIISLGTVTPGSGPFVSGIYTPVQTTGGHGTGAELTVTVVGPGPLSSLGVITPGTGYNNNTYLNVPLTGGTGTGALATVVITGGFVVEVFVTTPGNGYSVGDVLSASNTNLGGAGSGFSIPVVAVGGTISSVVLASAGLGYTAGDTLTFGGIPGLGADNSTVAVTGASAVETGTITLQNNQPMFTVGQSVYVINTANASCQTPWWAFTPQTPSIPAVQSGMILGTTVTYTNSATSPTITYSVRVGNNPGVVLLDQSVVFVDKPTAIAAYEALNL